MVDNSLAEATSSLRKVVVNNKRTTALHTAN